jgi:hypothetical protein
MTSIARALPTAATGTSLSSTTPDTPERSRFLSVPGTLAWGTGLGVAAGMLLMRSRGAGWSLAALGTGALRGAALGAGLGASLVGLDRVTGGEVKQQLDYVLLDRRAQVLFVLRHPTKPWLASTGLGVARDARAAQEALYGMAEPTDGPQDAFRHTWAAALLALRAMRDHGVPSGEAQQLAIEAGEAHEVDGQDNNDALSRAMDEHNNAAGAALAGDGRARPGEQADSRGFVTEHALRERVLDAIADGDVELVDRTADPARARESSAADLPPRR